MRAPTPTPERRRSAECTCSTRVCAGGCGAHDLPREGPLEESEHLGRVVPVHRHLAEEREARALASRERLDRGGVAGLLLAEAVAGEGEHGEAAGVELGVEVAQAVVVALGVSAGAGHVHDQHDGPGELREELGDALRGGDTRWGVESESGDETGGRGGESNRECASEGESAALASECSVCEVKVRLPMSWWRAGSYRGRDNSDRCKDSKRQNSQRERQANETTPTRLDVDRRVLE